MIIIVISVLNLFWKFCSKKQFWHLEVKWFTCRDLKPVTVLALFNNRSIHQRPTLQSWSFDNLNKALEKICEGVCFLVKIQTVGHNPITNEFLFRYFRYFAESLVTLSDIRRTPI